MDPDRRTTRALHNGFQEATGVSIPAQLVRNRPYKGGMRARNLLKGPVLPAHFKLDTRDRHPSRIVETMMASLCFVFGSIDKKRWCTEESSLWD